MKIAGAAPHFADPELARAVGYLEGMIRRLANAVPGQASYYATVVTGRLGAGEVPIPPLKDPAGNILRRANIGATVVTVLDTVNAIDRQLSFEDTISVRDQIQQLNTGNLSALTFWVLVAG